MATIATLKDLVDALIETGIENGNIETITNDLRKFFNFVSNNTEIKNVLSADAFEVEERCNVIADISANASFLDETRNFLVLAAELDKFSSLLNKEEELIRQLEQAAGKLKAEITAAQALTESDLNRIKESLYKATGREVEIEVNIDTSIVGGLITKIGDKVFDNSIKTQLEKIQGVLTP